jgi:hypothetical protein
MVCKVGQYPLNASYFLKSGIDTQNRKRLAITVRLRDIYNQIPSGLDILH